MSVNFSIDSQRVFGIQCKWRQEIIANNLDVTQTFSDYANHTWNTESIRMIDYISLRGLRGQQIELTTTDINSSNDEAIYSDAILTEIVGNQQGHLLKNVQMTFKVFVA